MIDSLAENTMKRKITIQQQNREMFAILIALRNRENLIGGSEITLFTDNKNILGDSGDFNKKTN